SAETSSGASLTVRNSVPDNDQVGNISTRSDGCPDEHQAMTSGRQDCEARRMACSKCMGKWGSACAQYCRGKDKTFGWSGYRDAGKWSIHPFSLEDWMNTPAQSLPDPANTEKRGRWATRDDGRAVDTP